MEKLKQYRIKLKTKGESTPSYFGTMAYSAKEALQKAKDFYKLAKNVKVGKAKLR